MSQNDDVRSRSVKLCQLVYNRKIETAIGFEIRKLLEEGVLIDFQDRNQKTSLHLAVEKGDVICVKFLLRFKPNLVVKDEDGKTPIGIAESNGYENIQDILLNSTVDVVNESFVELLDFANITPQKIDAIKSRATFKVLELINCPSLKEVWMKLNDHGYTRTLNESAHLFFIAIETKESSIENDHEMMIRVLNFQRPMIVQLSSSSIRDFKVYFKDEKDFVEITDTTRITQEEFNEAVESESDCNMKLLVTALRSNIFGECTGNLLDTKLNTNKSRGEAVNKFAKSNALCHRFFKLFDENPKEILTVTATSVGRLVGCFGLSGVTDYNSRLHKLLWQTTTRHEDSELALDRILATLSFKGDQSLLALLDLPSKLTEGTLKLTEDILSIVDSRNYNLLMLAAELNNFDAVKLLIRCGCDFNHSGSDGKRASDICWDMKSFDGLAQLIEAGSPYPINFSIEEMDESSDAHKKIAKMIAMIGSFHANIEQGATDEVEKFVTSNSNIKNAYDTNNKCALTVALDPNQIDVYSRLLSEGFKPGADDEYCEAFNKFRNKEIITNSHRKYFKEAFDEPHLKRLLNKYRLSFNSKDRAKCSTVIRKMFDKLNEIDEAIPILKICSLSNKLRIVFDFNCKSVVDMDPVSESNTLGILYPISGFIYIGAENHKKEFYKVIGALIHELTHYAMKLTYENECKPYAGVNDNNANDIANEIRFETIATETKKVCDENPSTDSIVTTVFSSYKKEVWHQELIVRVPHLLAHHRINSKALEAAERNTPELFQFYREKTLNDVERESKALLREYLINKINSQTGIARKIQNLNVWFDKLETIDWKIVNVIASNAPHLTLAMLNQIDGDDSHIFVTLEQIAIGNILEKIVKVNAKDSSTVLIVDCIALTQKYPESLRKLLKYNRNIKTIALVMTESESSITKGFCSKVEFKTFNHKWGELTESSKVNLLDQNVIFQGVEMKLNAIVEPSSEAMKFFPLDKILDCKKIEFSHELHQTSHSFYIDRKFIKKGQDRLTLITANANSFKKLLKDEPMMGAMIISDEAGSGKSVTLYEVAKSLHMMYPDRWVQFVDLKRHIEAFKSIENYENIKSFEDFIGKHILKNDTKFDRELFKEMFQNGKTFVLFDGFDEISPNYKELLLHVLNLFEPESGNQLYITTRPHLEADLEGALGQFVFKLEEFSEESQTSFLREYWHSVKYEMSHEDFEVLSNRLIEKFGEIAALRIIGLPLLMRMTAEIFEDPIKENSLGKVDYLSISSVFQKFVEKHLARWTNNENEIARSENVDFVMAGGILEIHHSIAIHHIFDGVFMSFGVAEGDAEKIARVGLIRFDKTEKTFQFNHETFAEYFVANFIWFHLNRKNLMPTHDCSLAIQVLMEVVSRVNFEVIKTFLDQIFGTMKFNPNKAFFKSVAKCLSEVIVHRNHFNFLRESLVAMHKNLASLSLSIIQFVKKEILLKMLQSRTIPEDRVLLHVAAHENSSVVSALCSIILSCIDDPKEIFQDKQEDNDKEEFENVLLRAAQNNNEGVLTTLCANMNSVLTKEEITIMVKQEEKFGGNIIAIASENNDAVFIELLSMLSNYLSHEEIKSLLLAVDKIKRNFLHRAISRNTTESLKLKFDVVKSNFTIEEQKTFFYQPASEIFHWATLNPNKKIFETLIEATSDVLTSDEIKSLMLQYSEGSNLLHNMARFGNEAVLIELSSLLRERLSDNEIRNLLLEVDSKGKNCFHLAGNNRKLNLQVFCETIGNLIPTADRTRLLEESIQKIDIIRLACGNYSTREILPVGTVKDLLTQKDPLDRNAFHQVALRGDVSKWNKLISFAQMRLSADEMKIFLFSCDKNGQNCLYFAISCFSFGNMVDAICKSIKTMLSVEDQKKLVRQKDSENRNLFHHASKCNLKFKFKLLYDSLSTILSTSEIKEMLLEKDIGGDNILTNIKYPNNSDILRVLMPFLAEFLANVEIKNLFFDVDSEGRNFFHCAVQFSSKLEIKFLSKNIKKILSQDDQKKFFGTKIPNFFHLATKNPNRKIFSTTHECLKDVLTENEIKCLIQEKDSDNRNVLYWICQLNANEEENILQANNDDDKRLRDFLNVLKSVCDADEVKTFLTSLSSNGSNCLLLAVQYQDILFLKELFNFIQSELSDDDQRTLIQRYDNEGYNIFKCAVRKSELGVFSTLHEYLKDVLTDTEIKSLILEKDSYNRNALHWICILEYPNDSEKRLRDFLKLLKDVCSAEELKTFLSSSDNHGSNYLLIAAQNKDPLFVMELFRFIRSELSIEKYRNLIQNCDNDGDNIFMCAALNNDLEVLSCVEQFVREMLADNQIDEMVMHMRQYGETDTLSDTDDR